MSSFLLIEREGTIEREGGTADQNPVLFNRPDFDELIDDHGYLVTWEKATLCPNRPRDALAPKRHHVNCSFCEGRGFLYFDPKNDVMLVQAVRLNQQFWAQGRWDVGSVIVTARPGVAISWWDRITLRNGVERFPEVVRRSLGGGPDTLKYAPTCIDLVSWVDRSGALATARVDVEFSVLGNQLTWAADAGPDAGSDYSISYRLRPRYVVQEMLHQHREQPDAASSGERRPFPVQAVAKLDFIVRDEGRDPTEIDEKDPFAVRR